MNHQGNSKDKYKGYSQITDSFNSFWQTFDQRDHSQIITKLIISYTIKWNL